VALCNSKYLFNAISDWFDPEWMFGVKEGFDIVIGNPPYIKEYRIWFVGFWR
jgi:methylase of polypeptide subunit release factors